MRACSDTDSTPAISIEATIVVRAVAELRFAATSLT